MLEYLLLYHSNLALPRRLRRTNGNYFEYTVESTYLAISHNGNVHAIVTTPVRCIAIHNESRYLGDILLLGSDGLVYRVYERRTPRTVKSKGLRPVDLAPYLL